MGKKFINKYSYNLEKVVGFTPVELDKRFILDNGKLSEFSGKSLRGDFLLSTYLNIKDVITYSFEMEKTLLEKVDIESYVETKSYEEAGLDETQEYLFKHKVLESFVDEKMLLVEVVIVSEDAVLTKKFEAVLAESNYIDFIAYPGFVFEVLYKKNILDISDDLFIYFNKSEIFLTFYSEGKFLQTLSIPKGLESIFTEVSELNIKDFDYSKFLKILIEKGLEQNSYRDKEKAIFNQLSEIFSNIFLLVSNQIFNVNRKFAIESIDRVFVGTEKGIIPGISEFSNLYLNLESSDLRFDKEYNPNNIDIEQILFLTMLDAQMSFKLENQIDNFSIFARPPTFFYRSSGQLITSVLASIILSSIYPLYQTIDTYFVNSGNQQLQIELDKKNSEKRELSHIKSSNLKKLKSIKAKIKTETAYLTKTKSVIETIYKYKFDYRVKTEALLHIFNYLNKNSVKILGIEIKDNIIVLKVISKKAIYITNFVNDLVNGIYPNTMTNGLSSYLKDKEEFYTSEIKVQL